MACWKPSQMSEYVNTETGAVFYCFKGSKKVNPYDEQSGRVKFLREFQVGCGQCSGCRSKYSRQWATRCYHESLFHEQKSFLTLTVDDDHMEEVFPGRNLRYKPFQDFMKRFRKEVGDGIRFFMCAEYGAQFSRPHFHSILFGWYPSSEDVLLSKDSAVGSLVVSKLVGKLWSFGFHSIGRFDFACAQYVAGYVAKKINGKMKQAWYQGRTPEFARMSLKPGIGEEFYRKYTGDLFRHDKVVLPGGSEMSVPRYYDKLHTLYHPGHMAKVKVIRELPDPVRDLENTPGRLAVRKEVHESRLKMKRRPLH